MIRQVPASFAARGGSDASAGDPARLSGVSAMSVVASPVSSTSLRDAQAARHPGELIGRRGSSASSTISWRSMSMIASSASATASVRGHRPLRRPHRLRARPRPRPDRRGRTRGARAHRAQRVIWSQRRPLRPAAWAGPCSPTSSSSPARGASVPQHQPRGAAHGRRLGFRRVGGIRRRPWCWTFHRLTLGTVTRLFTSQSHFGGA